MSQQRRHRIVSSTSASLIQDIDDEYKGWTHRHRDDESSPYHPAAKDISPEPISPDSDTPDVFEPTAEYQRNADTYDPLGTEEGITEVVEDDYDDLILRLTSGQEGNPRGTDGGKSSPKWEWNELDEFDASDDVNAEEDTSPGIVNYSYNRIALDSKAQRAAARILKEGSLDYDGMVVWEAGVGDTFDTEFSWVPLSNKQVKSATNNNGDFDATNPDIRFSLPESPQQASAPSQADQGNKDAQFSLSPRQPWQPDFPTAVLAHRLSALNNHPDYQEAKAGDDAAAIRVARDLVTSEFVEQVRAMIPDGSSPQIVPVLAMEAVGENRIPALSAVVLADRLGLEASDQITQIERVSRTGANALERLAKQPTFEGKVAPGDYLLIDDTLTQGGTLAQLKAHIEHQGGRVVGVTALTGKQYSAKLALNPSTLEAVRERFGSIENWWRDTFATASTDSHSPKPEPSSPSTVGVYRLNKSERESLRRGMQKSMAWAKEQMAIDSTLKHL